MEAIGEGSNKCFHRYISSKIKTWENVGLMIKDVEKAEVVNAFFASAFTSKTRLQEC